MKNLSANLFLLALLFISCSHLNSPAQAQGQLKISQFNQAGWCDLLIDKSGVYHAVFQEIAGTGKPMFIYYSSSTNRGASWGKPISLSDDKTGNGAGYPRILQDGSGKIYAIWKRYGKSGMQYPIGNAVLDGPGGYAIGTVFYKVLNGGTWSNQVQVNETEAGQDSWFATVAPNGGLYIFWAQAPVPTITAQMVAWDFCDLLRVTLLNGTSHSAITNLSTPAPLTAGGYPSKRDGAMNLNGYIDDANKPHFIYEDNENNVGRIMYYDGKSPQRIIYSYPAFKQNNTFVSPAHLLVDENGVDHVIFEPAPEAMGGNQLWDINITTNKASILTQIQQAGIFIRNFQASQGPNGAMAVTIEAGGMSGSAEAFGLFYKNGTWTNIALTKNAAKTKFLSKDFVALGGYLANVSLLTTYISSFASVAYDASGRKSLLMTIAEHTVGNSGYGIENPFITFMAVDR